MLGFRSRNNAVSKWDCGVLPVACLALATANLGCRMAADGQNLDGVRLYQQGNFNPALQRFQNALAANPDNADAYYNLARTTHEMAKRQGDQEKYDQAETLYNQCLDLNEDHVDCHRALAVLLVETDRADRAFKLMENWTMSNPQLAEARVELARLYDEFNDHETATHHLNEALTIDQYNPRAWAALGRHRDERGEYEQALVNYQRSLQLRFQPKLAERVAQLNRTLRGDVGGVTPGGTRTVSNPMRY